MRCFQLLFACLFCFTVPASPQVSIELWTTDNGLPQNIIRGICQTPDGYLWLATFDGLVRFDGVRFTTFNRTNTPEIKGNRFGSLFCADNGDFWAATDGSGVTRRHGGRFLAATQQIVTARPGAQVIIVTSHNEASLREAARKAGARGYILKENLLEIRQWLKPNPGD